MIARYSLDVVSPPSIVRPGLPEALEDAFLKALSKVPADRFATATLFVEALAVPSRPSSLRRRPTGSTVPARRRAWLKPAGAVAGGVVLIAVTWAVLAGIRARDEALRLLAFFWCWSGPADNISVPAGPHIASGDVRVPEPQVIPPSRVMLEASVGLLFAMLRPGRRCVRYPERME